MIRLWKKFARRPGVPMDLLPSGQDLDNSSPAELRQVIYELEAALAEHEATNAFLRDLLTQRWFETEGDHVRDSLALQRL